MITDAYFDPKILAKYNTSGPRYTSYPTALQFSGLDDPHAMIAKQMAPKQWVHQHLDPANKSMSLYIHIPFCHSLCYYCGCNKIVTRQAHKADQYIDFLCQEIAIQASLFKGMSVSQLHFGGGTPSFLSIQQLAKILAAVDSQFTVSKTLELSIEIDPRRIELEYISQLGELGFNRLSIGVQDTNTEVQEKINRVQSTPFIASIVDVAKHAGFSSINLDVIYGLPMQNPNSFANTLQDVIDINPDRISLFSYAHMPSLFASQRKIKDEWLPDANAKLSLFRQAIERFTQADYDFIGMDHFAKAEDELSIAAREGRLFRNFQGYSAYPTNTLLGLGVSAISSIDNVYLQNEKDLKAYYQRLEAGLPAQIKGVELDEDDRIRRRVISDIMCNFHLDKQAIEREFSIEFDRYFADTLVQLKEFEQDELIRLNEHSIEVRDKGRMLVRNISMNFDAYLSKQAHHQRYSRVI